MIWLNSKLTISKLNKKIGKSDEEMIPEKEELYKPISKFLFENGKQKKTNINKYLIEIFEITPEELSLKRKLSNNKVVYNTIGWALDTLQRYGIILNSEGFWEMTEVGREFVSTLDTTADYTTAMKSLKKVQESIKQETKTILPSKTIDNLEDENPLDIIEFGYSKYLEVLEDELLAKLLTVTPDKFEQIVCDLLEAMGYGETVVTGRSGDRGIDALVYQDELQLDIICLQAKRLQKGNKVPPKEVRDLSGVVTNNQYKAGILITTLDFSRDAKQEAEKNSKIKLITGEKLVELLVEYQVGVTLFKFRF